jgi:hypothetical protein
VATTDASGRWTFGSVPGTNIEFWISVNHTGYPKAGFHTDANEGNYVNSDPLKLAELRAGTAVLTLKSGLGLRGVVTDEQQNTIGGARVTFGEYSGSSNPGAETGPDGSFTLTSLSAGPGHVTVVAKGYAPERVAVNVGNDSAPLNVQLKPAAWLRVRVVDESGNALSHVDVRLQDWRGNNSLEWGGLTDDKGRIDWNSAPRDTVDLYAGKQSYFNSRNNLIVADGEEHTIKLHPQLTVSGSVVDATTGRPIADFKAIPGSEPAYWERHNTAHGTNGEYELKFEEFRAPFQVRIEADGYEPAISPPLPPNTNSVAYDFKLKKLDSQSTVQGVVLLPDGSPAAGAQVALCTAEKGIQLGRAKFLDRRYSIVVDTDPAGHFAFPFDPAPKLVAAVHPQGFGRVQLNATNRNVSIVLQPWGRIEGTLKLRDGKNAGRQINLSAISNPYSRQGISLDFGTFSAKTDEHGNFTFDQVPPGDFNLDLFIGFGIPFSHQTPVEVLAGETQKVQIGGTGRMVSGRFVFSDANRAIDWPKQAWYAHIATKLPPLPVPAGLKPAERQKWQEEYYQSAEGQARTRASRSYSLTLESDGSFTAEDVPPGSYELNAMFMSSPVDHTAIGAGTHNTTLGTLRQDVVVPDPTSNQSEAPVDLGTVTIPVTANGRN